MQITFCTCMTCTLLSIGALVGVCIYDNQSELPVLLKFGFVFFIIIIDLMWERMQRHLKKMLFEQWGHGKGGWECWKKVLQHRRGQQRATGAADDRFLVIQAGQNLMQTATLLWNDLQNASGGHVSTQTVVFMRQNSGHVDQVCGCLWCDVMLKSVCSGPRIMSVGPWMTGGQCSSLKSLVSVSTIRTETQGHGDVLEKHSRGNRSLTMTDMLGDQWWSGMAYPWLDEHFSMSLGIECWLQLITRMRSSIPSLYHAAAVGLQFIVMDDDARPHRARVVADFLKQKAIMRMEWPARSPDLNPIEHVSDMLGHAVSMRVVLDELVMALEEEWQRLPQQEIRRLISMTHGRQSVINAQGYHTHYWILIILPPLT